MKKSELRDSVYENTGRSDKESVTNKGLDNALKTLSQLKQFKDIQVQADASIAEGDLSLQLPSTLRQIKELRLLDTATSLAAPIELVRKTTFVERFPDVSTSMVSGRPSVVYDEGGVLYFNCRSSGVYTLRMTYITLAKFQSDDSENPIKDSDEVLIAYATASVYRSLQMYKDADAWDKEFIKLQRVLISAKEKELGVHLVALPWNAGDSCPVSTDPAHDPFAGV